ncbi:MAG: J domain-containing protein [Planctomycetota bacterium]
MSADFTLLPASPVNFFGLSEEFDRRDLKRAYGGLIRAYKPETHPREFQLIREAYEHLESAIRYGVKKALAQNQSEAWDALIDKVGDRVDSGQATQSIDSVLSITQAAVKSPAKVFAKLRDQNTRSPQDYFVLCFLSDLVSRGDRRGFFRWLLRGLKDHPSDPGLQSLVSSFLRTDVSDGDAAAALQALAKVLRGQDYFRVTEPLWDRVLDSLSFEDFQKLFVVCRQQIVQVSPTQEAAFQSRLLRLAMFKAPLSWIEETQIQVQAISGELEGGFGDDFDLLDSLVDYRRETERRDFAERLKKDPVFRKIDEMVRAYCQADWAKCAEVVTSAMDFLGRNQFSVMTALDNRDSERDWNIVQLALLISGESAQMVGLEPRQVSDRKLSQQASQTFLDLRETLHKVWMRHFWHEWRLPLLYVGLPVFLLAYLLWGSVTGATLFVVSLTGAISCAVLYWFVLKPKFIDLREQERQRRFWQMSYNRLWRSRLFRFVQSAAVPLEHSVQVLQQAGELHEQPDWAQVIAACASNDPGLVLFADSQRFVS